MTAPVLFQALPPLSREEYAALEQSIKEYGVQTPIVVDERGVIIDGHHRDKIAEDLGIDCPRIVRADLDETAKRSLALSLNIDRRHLTREQKRALVEESLKADPQLSDRQHATRAGSSPTTVGAVRCELEEAGRLSKLDSRTSADGRQRPAFAAATNRHPEPEPLPRPERTVQVESAQDVADHLAAIDDSLREEIVDTPTSEVTAASKGVAQSAGKKRRTFDKHAALNVGADLQRVNNRIYKLANDDLLDKHLDLVRRYVGFEASHTLIAVSQLLDKFGAERLPQSEEARAAWATSLLNAAEALQRLGHSLQQEQ